MDYGIVAERQKRATCGEEDGGIVEPEVVESREREHGAGESPQETGEQ